jgi:hypothetical protein
MLNVGVSPVEDRSLSQSSLPWSQTIILSEAKDLWYHITLTIHQSEMFRVGQHDSARCPV